MDHICSCLVCSLQPCGHLLERGLPLGCDVLLCFCHFAVWCPRSGVVLDFRFLVSAFFLTLPGAYDNLYLLLATKSLTFTCIMFQVQVKTPSVRIVVKNCQIDIIEPRHEISKIWYVRPEKPQISLRIRAV